MNIAEDIVMCMPFGIAKSAAQNTTPDLPPCRLKITCSLPVVLSLRETLQPNTAPMSRRHRWSRRCFDAGLGARAAAAPPPPAAPAAHLGWIHTIYNLYVSACTIMEIVECKRCSCECPQHIHSSFGLSSSAATAPTTVVLWTWYHRSFAG